MSFYPVHSSHARDDQPLHACDDLEAIDEHIHLGLDADRDSLSHRVKDNTPQLTQHGPAAGARYDDEHKEPPASSSLSTPSPAHQPHLSSAFPFHSPFHAHKHTKSSSSICSLPASPTDVSNEHGARGGGGGVGGSRRVSRSADPATLFLLHRIMKGDVFTLYTPSTVAQDSFDATPVFVFYDAHGRLGSLYWTTQRKHAHSPHHTIHEDDDADSSAAPSSLAASHFARHKSPSHCLPIHTLSFVGHGKPALLSPALTASPLPSAAFLTLTGPAHTLRLSHSQASVVRQWVACLRDIFVQNGHAVRDGEGLVDEAGKGGAGGGKGAAGLLGLFAEPLDGSDDDGGSGSGSGSDSGSSSGGRNSVVDVDSRSDKRGSLSVSEKGADCDLLDKRKERKESMATCQCIIS